MQSNDGVLDVSTDLALNNGGDNDKIVSIGRESSACNVNEHLVDEHRLDKDQQPIDSQSMSSDQVQEETEEAAASMAATSRDKSKTSSVAGGRDAISPTALTGEIKHLNRFI